MKLGFGLKTDGHMVSVLFERVIRGPSLAITINETKMQKRNLNLANITKGIYPLYKIPTGISDQDRIAGINPGTDFHLT